MKPPPDPSTHKYMLVKKGADNRYFKKLTEAKAAVSKELKDTKKIWTSLNAKEDEALVELLFDQLDDVGVDGGVVSGPVSTRMMVTYRAEIVLRNPL